MLRTLRALVAFSLALGLSVGAANAASIVRANILNPPAGGKFGLGDVMDVQIAFDFQDKKTFGGGVELNFDPKLVEVVSFELDGRWSFDPADPASSFSRPLGFFDTRPRALAFGDFTPFRGTGIVGLLRLRAIAMGDGSVMPTPNDEPAGPFIDENIESIEMSFESAQFSIVPEPGTLLLVGAGLLGLATTRRSRG